MPDREQLAAERTDYAEDRTVLAAERTYTAWLRTGLAFLVAGLGALQLLDRSLPGWSLRPFATLLVLCGAGCFAAATWRYDRVRARLPQAGIRFLPPVLVLCASATLLLIALFAAAAVWLA